ncbi:bifunctional hydroxymethylpyrimidine kinase/phosphomethylpyrimidine kinase [Protaetiibacter sp. SSC-01]|uniref:carbohydrate kinase family protein n=1 Tax=Protaetiibacter sp. SSC-01 TaxID=2759943 RepID=UPI0016569966|nr:PfkB family carbohydrate kinase [Protaetiibacter sp. SSC-01]QNO37698.1 bifunctional hydroxymethylpyrimidine kinase/phosphomethylpyrimidine kinase [Protaetiibacter sp. SSC-01]
MTARVLVAGDANLDLVLRGDVVPRFGQAEQLLEGADLVLGSSAGICAAGLARLGVATSLVARVGDDVFGARTRELLEQAGVDTASVSVMSDEPTGVSVILSATDDRAILTLTGALARVTAHDVLAAADDATHLHVASFFLVPALAAELPRVLAELRSRGATTSLDTNWDPAEAWAGVAECLPHLDLLLPNAQEAIALARALGDEPADAVEAARSLAARGPVVVVKDGAAGGFAATPHGEVVRAPGLVLDVVDTTGAGDSFDAGFLAAWLDGRPLAEAVRWAAVAGSLSTRGAGGTGGQATRAEVEAELSA